METDDYNNRLQLARAQLGTAASGQSDEYNCKVYNDYQGIANATSCALPGQPSSGNNGSVAGYWYSNSDTSYNHAASFGYDSVNRLTSASATGNSAYSMTFDYTRDGSNGQYGNLHCSVTQGVCNATLNARPARLGARLILAAPIVARLGAAKRTSHLAIPCPAPVNCLLYENSIPCPPEPLHGFRTRPAYPVHFRSKGA